MAQREARPLIYSDVGHVMRLCLAWDIETVPNVSGYAAANGS